MSNEALDWRQLGAVKREKAAELLGGISPQTVDDMLRAGTLHGRKAGRCVLVSVHSLRAYLGEVAPAAVSAPEPTASEPTASRAKPTQPAPQLSRADLRILAEARRRVG